MTAYTGPRGFGGGDVDGPASSTANAAAIFSGTTGKLLLDSKVVITPPATGATLTLSNNSSLITSGGHSITFTSTGATNVTLPTTGTLVTLAGSETLTNKTLTSPVMTTPTLGVAAATSINFGGTALANYLEGTFTPTVTLVGGAGNTTPVYSVNSGRHTRIGNRCFVKILLSGDGGAEGAGTGVVNIALPIAASASEGGGIYTVGRAGNSTTRYLILGQIASGASTISLSYWDTITTNADFTGAQQNNASRSIVLDFNYQV